MITEMRIFKKKLGLQENKKQCINLRLCGIIYFAHFHFTTQIMGIYGTMMELSSKVELD